MAHRVVLSTKLAAGYPQLSFVPVAAGIVMPGVHDGAPEGALQVFPTVPPVGVQSEPLQQRLGRGDVWGVHVRPGAQPPVESQRQPWVPTMHVVGAPEAGPRPASAPFPPASAPFPLLWDPQLASTIVNAARAPIELLGELGIFLSFGDRTKGEARLSSRAKFRFDASGQPHDRIDAVLCPGYDINAAVQQANARIPLADGSALVIHEDHLSERFDVSAVDENGTTLWSQAFTFYVFPATSEPVGDFLFLGNETRLVKLDWHSGSIAWSVAVHAF
jgi:hypothetical protein